MVKVIKVESRFEQIIKLVVIKHTMAHFVDSIVKLFIFIKYMGSWLSLHLLISHKVIIGTYKLK